MMSFWIFAGLLIVIALYYVLSPLLQSDEQTDDEGDLANVPIYRDQLAELDRDLRDGVLDQELYEQGRLELQRRLIQDAGPEPGAERTAGKFALHGQRTAIFLGAAIPLLAVFLYFQIGTPQTLTPGQPALSSRQNDEAVENAPAGQPGTPTQEEIEKRVAGLAARLKENPNDAQGWVMLARSYRNFKRYREASDAYARAVEVSGNDANLWADYAESLALANDSMLQGRPLELINKALQLEPANQKALWLAGSAAFQSQDYRQAISYWEKLKKLLPEGSEDAQSIAASIEEARTKNSGK